MLIFFVTLPQVKVTVALRRLVPVLACSVAVMLSFPLPLVLLRVSQEALSVAVQLPLDTTVIVRVLPLPEVLTFSVSSFACVMLSVFVTLPQVKVIGAVRALLVVLGCSVTVMDALPVPLVLLSVSQAAFSVAVQLPLEVTVIVRVLPLPLSLTDRLSVFSWRKVSVCVSLPQRMVILAVRALLVVFASIVMVM